MFKIGEFSKLSGLSADTLYHYEKMRILMPKSIDKLTGYRFYDADQLLTVNKILALKDAGFSLDEIAEIVGNGIPTASLVDILTKKALSMEDAIKKESRRLERLHTNIFLIKNGGIPLVNEIVIKRVEPILVASVRKAFGKDNFDENLEIMWRDVNKYITEKGGKRTIPCMMLYHAGFWEIEPKAESLDVEVVEPVVSIFESSAEVRVYELPAVETTACIVHNGSFSTIFKACGSLFEWIGQNGYKVNGPVREIYHKGDWATDNQEEYITEIQVPVNCTDAH